MPRPDISALKILSHTSRSFGENLKIIFFSKLPSSLLFLLIHYLSFLSCFEYFFESERISVTENSHTHTLLFPSACECLLCLEAVSNPRMCRCATTHPLQTALASVWVFVLFCVSACKCVFACVVSAEDVCVRIGELLFMQIFARIFRLLFHRGLLHCFLTLDPAGVCVRGRRSAAAVAIS